MLMQRLAFGVNSNFEHGMGVFDKLTICFWQVVYVWVPKRVRSFSPFYYEQQA